MLALRVTYLMGRVYSSDFDDGDAKSRPEWPPHPSRLYSALVASWAEGGAEPELRRGLEWLEKQDPPEILFGRISRRSNVQVYVPVNDHKSLPEVRPRKARSFPSATLLDPDVYFIWNSAPPKDVFQALDAIANRTSSLGHSSSLVSIELTKDLPPNLTRGRWQPGVASGIRLRIPYMGRLDELIQRYALFERNPSKIHRPTRGKTTIYGIPAPDNPSRNGVFGRMIILRRVAGPRTGLRSTLSLTAALRGALLRLSPKPIPECISGHAPGSTAERPLKSEKPHVALVPLAFVGSAHATGEIMGLAALIPSALEPKEEEACWKVLATVNRLTTRWGEWKVELADAEERRRNLRPEVWTEKCTTWATVTPLVLIGIPKILMVQKQ